MTEGKDDHIITEAPQTITTLDYIVLAVIGTLGGLLIWSIGEGDLIAKGIKPQFAMLVLSITAGFTLLWRSEQIIRRLGFILALALLLSGLTWLTFANGKDVDEAPVFFWVAIGAPLLGFLMSAFARASFRERALFWPYGALWRSGASLLADGIIASAVGLAAIAFVALWGAAFKAFGMSWAADIAHNAAFLIPLGGGAAALAGGLARSNTRLGEAVRSVLLIGCRVGLPLAALFSLVFAIGIIGGGADSLEKVPFTPAGLLLALALASELIFNGVYQDGTQKPPRWLRLFSWVALAILPIYTLAAAAALWMRVDSYGLTPPRMIALIALTLTAAYTVLLLLGLLSELFSKRFSTWMPPVAKLNTLMALVWIATLILMHTPLLDPVSVSARNQASRLLANKALAETFDFGFLQFKLGEPGKQALERLAQSADPKIMAGIEKARNAKSYRDYKNADKKKEDRTQTDTPKDKTLQHLNTLLAPADLVMDEAAKFDYGTLAYAKGEVGENAFAALEKWAAIANPEDSGPVRITRERVRQGLIAARLAGSMANWQAASEAANAFMKTFERDVKSVQWKVRQLGGMAGEDRAVRTLFEKHTRNAEAIPSAEAVLNLLYAGAFVDDMDERHLEKLKKLLRKKPWFDPDKIGRFAEQDAWLIVLHANHDLDFQEQVLAAIEPRALTGAFDGRRYAHLYDIVARARGKPQRYGTKSLCENGRWVADVTEDPEQVDERRAQMGLAPLAQTLEQENARFGECQN
jgi:Family of unknown function (DUF6624)/Domain of unknown function (DUF4153)